MSLLHIHRWKKLSEHCSADKTYRHEKYECICGAIKHKLKRPDRKEVVKIIEAHTAQKTQNCK
jgi:hypothetical protein